MERGDDPYEILGVTEDATEGEIKHAFRKGALKFHPDKQHTEEDKAKAHVIFVKLAAAYETVSDPVKRYDWNQAHGSRQKKAQTKTGTTPTASHARSKSPKRSSSQAQGGGAKPAPAAASHSRSTSPKRNSAPSQGANPASPKRASTAPKKATGERPTPIYNPSPRSTPKSPKRTSTVPPGHGVGTSGFPPPPPHSKRTSAVPPGHGATRTSCGAPPPSPKGTSAGESPTPSYNPSPRSTPKSPKKKSAVPPGHGVGTSGFPPPPPHSKRTSAVPPGHGATRTSCGASPPPPSPKRKSAGERPTPSYNPSPRSTPKSPKRKSAVPPGSPSPRSTPKSPKRTSAVPPGHGGTRTSCAPPPPIYNPSRQFRDPFDIFEDLMTEEYGVDYKKEDIWTNSKGVSGLSKKTNSLFKQICDTTHKDFKKFDTNKDHVLTKDEFYKYIEDNPDMWSTLGVQLNLTVRKSVELATDVAFALATGRGITKLASHDESNPDSMTESEFRTFHQKYILDAKGSHECFLRIIFAAYDVNGDGVLDRPEFEKFLEIFYERESALFQGNMRRLPEKQKLMHIIGSRLDKNKDGLLSFGEAQSLMEVAAVVTKQ